MANLGHPGESTRFYRRGAIMGLTVAETFIILVFALLLLLLLMGNRLKEEEKKEPIDPQIEEVVTKLEQLSPRERTRLVKFIKSGNPIDRLDELVEFEQRKPEPPIDPQTEQLKTSLQEIDPKELRRLMTLMKEANLEQQLQEFEEWQQFNENSSRQELVERLRALDETELIELSEWMQTEAFEKVFAERESVLELIKLRESESLLSTLVAKDIRKEVGAIVKKYGGQIGPDGVISFATAGHFSSNDSSLTAKFKKVLDELCPNLLQSLHKHADSIRSVRVEGHASSEWRSDSAKERFLNNLDLSQRRAYEVLAYCLEGLPEGTDLYEWATQTVTAVGFSSARPIFGPDNSEDKEASRRVAFSYIENYEQTQ